MKSSKRFIDLDDPQSDERVKLLLKIKAHSFWSIIKLKIHEVTLMELFTYVISLMIIIPYVVMIIKGDLISVTFDTIAKIVIGAYIGKIVGKVEG